MYTVILSIFVFSVFLAWTVDAQLQPIGCLAGDYPNPTSDTCTSFFRCLNGQVVPFRCPEEERFDFRQRRCVPDGRIDCTRQLRAFVAPPLSQEEADAAARGGQGAFQPNQFFANDPRQGQIDPQTRLILLPNGIVQRQFVLQQPGSPNFNGGSQLPGTQPISGRGQTLPGTQPLSGNQPFAGNQPLPGTPQFLGNGGQQGNTQFGNRRFGQVQGGAQAGLTPTEQITQG